MLDKLRTYIQLTESPLDTDVFRKVVIMSTRVGWAKEVGNGTVPILVPQGTLEKNSDQPPKAILDIDLVGRGDVLRELFFFGGILLYVRTTLRTLER